MAGKKIIVTGASGGIGGAAVRALAAAGAAVACTFNSTTPALPDGVRSARCDITDHEQVYAVVDRFVAELQGLDGLVHAAGIHGSCPAADVTEGEWDRMFAANVKGTVFTNQAAYRYLQERGGSIVNMGSVEGVRGFAGNAHYAASRGAVMAWTRSVALEWGPRAVRVNAAAPVVETQIAQRMRDQLDEGSRQVMEATLRTLIPLGGQMGDPDRDMAPVLVFLMSDASRFITGQTIPVDGGFMMVGS